MRQSDLSADGHKELVGVFFRPAQGLLESLHRAVAACLVTLEKGQLFDPCPAGLNHISPVGLQLVGSQDQVFNHIGEIVIQFRPIGPFETVADGVQFAFGKADSLSVNLRIRVVFSDELPAPANSQSLQNFVERILVLFGLAEILPQVRDAGGEQRLAVVTREQPQLMIQVKNRVVDRRGRQQDEFFVRVPLGDDLE